METHSNVPDKSGDLIVRQGDLDEWQSGRAKYLILGWVAYEDVFGGLHWLSYCFRLNPDFTYSAYSDYNGVGDGKF